MASIESLKEQARRHEQKEEWQKALTLYQQAIAKLEAEEQPDIGLYNRVGDLQTRLGNVEAAVQAYEQAVDLYLDSELPNNAIAVCKKIIRNMPLRNAVYLKMGKIRAEQGFLVDARQNFLTYAERVQAAGDIDEALRALVEFAELSPDDAEIRVAIAGQLEQHDRKDEAVDLLTQGYRILTARGDSAEAAAIEARIKELDPMADLEAPAMAGVGGGGFETTALSDHFADDDVGEFGEIRIGGGEEEPEEEEEEDESEVAVGDFGGFDISTGEDEEAPALPAEPAGEPAGAAARSDDFTLGGFSLGEDEPGEDEPGEDEPGEEEPGEEEAEEEEAEALPMMDFGDEAEEEAEPLPMMAFGDEDEADPSIDFGEVEEDSEPLPMMTFGEDEDEEAAEPLPTMDLGEEEEAEPLPMMTFGDDDEASPPPLPAEAGEEAREEPAFDAAAFGESDRGDREDQEYVGHGEDMPVVEVGLDASFGAETADAPAARAREEAAEDARFETRIEEARPSEGGPGELLDEGRRLAGEGRTDDAVARFYDAQAAYDRDGDIAGALEATRALAEAQPDEVSHRQRVVELAFRTNDGDTLVAAYLELAWSLQRNNQPTRAQAVFQQVLSVDPGNREARAGVQGAEPRKAPVREVASSEDYIDLGSMILDDEETEKSTRFVVAYEEPSGDEQADFAKMLSQFKQKVSENLSADDVKAHHDLGTAYKEMGLLDEAIEEYQQALRASAGHLPTYEMLGQCFMEQGRTESAVKALSRALDAPWEIEDELLGIYYYLGRAYETLGNSESAVEFYDRVFSLDINFADVTERLRALR